MLYFLFQKNDIMGQFRLLRRIGLSDPVEEWEEALPENLKVTP